MTRPLLFSPKEMRVKLDVGEKTYLRLVRSGQLGYVLVGSRKKHTQEDADEYIKTARMQCPSSDARGHRTGGTTSRSKVIGFEEALRQRTAQRQR